MPHVLWREGAKDLYSGPEEDIPIGRNILVLKDVRETKNYTCVASSELGNIEADVQVKVKGRGMIRIVFFFHLLVCQFDNNISHTVRKGTLCHIQTTKALISLHISAG